MDTVTEVALAKAEALKRFRAAVRLETSIAADYVIGMNLPTLKKRMDDEVAAGGIPALQSGTSSLARAIAEELSKAMEPILQKVLEAGDDPQEA